jgi:hypothetical protein
MYVLERQNFVPLPLITDIVRFTWPVIFEISHVCFYAKQLTPYFLFPSEEMFSHAA